MNLIYLQTFLIVADEQSFTQAAKVLNVSKGLVSRHVKKLEDSYNSILELALQGMGLASLPFYQVEDLISSGELIHAFPEWSLQTHKLSLIYTQRRVMPKKMSAFNQAVMQWLASNDLYLIADKGKITHC